jgi:hypothetical protein
VYHAGPIYRRGDARLDVAMENELQSLVLLRCQAPGRHQKGSHHCGKVLGEVLETVEGRLVLAYAKRPNPNALGTQLLHERKVPTSGKLCRRS